MAKEEGQFYTLGGEYSVSRRSLMDHLFVDYCSNVWEGLSTRVLGELDGDAASL